MAQIIIYDPSDPIVPNKVTKFIPSGHTPDYEGQPNILINPPATVSFDFVPSRYWKESGGTIVEMNSTEKQNVDTSLTPKDYTLTKNAISTRLSSAGWTAEEIEFLLKQTGR